MSAAAGLHHPFSGALYELEDDGNVRVTDKDGSWGLFQPNGRWVRGTVRESDAQLCNWVAGPRFGNHRLTPAQ